MTKKFNSNFTESKNSLYLLYRVLPLFVFNPTSFSLDSCSLVIMVHRRDRRLFLAFSEEFEGVPATWRQVVSPVNLQVG